MFLTMLRLLPLLMLQDAGDAGDGGDAGTDQTPTTGGTPDAETGGGTPPAPAPAAQPSANKLIKDFVKDRGITIEDLLSEYSTLKDANKTEFERLTGQVDDFKAKYEQSEARYRGVVARSAVTDEATKAGAISPKAVYALIRDDVEFDKAGEPTNIAELIAQAKTDEPQLFRAAGGSGDGGKGNSSPQMTDMNAVLRGMARNAT